MEFNIDKSVQEQKQTSNSVLLDVRTVEEYKEGHIPGSINLPLDVIHTITLNKELPIFVYCRSGRRSGLAVEEMKKLGYTNAKNIGGIIDYTGSIEK